VPEPREPSHHVLQPTVKAPVATVASGSASGSVVTDPDELPAGAMLAGRYRIVARLGKGGMGVVFRADDLTLGVSVALKFLPAELAADTAWLERFKGEVRLARQISHANICRVYDIGESGGRQFLSMEYVDGEDLASTLRRLGRLPPESAVRIARQLCFGLAAAHEQGVIHRDLKPANVMIDGRGNAKIMDFGVAGLASDLAGSANVVCGTPAYMAPEQRAGIEVTKRSDLYSLGLVLYELFTGREAFAEAPAPAREKSSAKGTRATRGPAPPSSLVSDLDPSVEAAIVRCLEEDPAQRPPSALAVAAGLPGGDPLAAALAAGETPSPELVARAGGSGRLGRGLAFAIAACAVACLIFAGVVGNRFAVHTHARMELPPEALAAHAREVLGASSGEPAPPTQAWGFSHRPDAVRWALDKSENNLGRAWPLIDRGPGASVLFWLRAQDSKLRPIEWYRRTVRAESPPRTDPGACFLATDTTGKLVMLERIAPSEGFSRSTATDESSGTTAAAPTDWTMLFKEAGLDRAAAKPAAVKFAPRVASDQRYAWDLEGEAGAARVEAATLDGVPVWFRVVPAWEKPAAAATSSISARGEIMELLISIALLAAPILAFVSMRNRRSDRASAARLALCLFTIEWLAMILPRHTIGGVIGGGILGMPAARALWIATLGYTAYVGIEPIVRKLWPRLLIGWTRLISGEFRDALVCREVLIGLLGGMVLAAFNQLPRLLGLEIGPGRHEFFNLGFLNGGRFATSEALSLVSGAATSALLYTLLLVGVKAIVRVLWIAYALLVILLVPAVAESADSLWGLLFGIATALCAGAVLTRVGILAAIVMFASWNMTRAIPVATDLSVWYAGPFATAYAGIALLSFVCAWVASRSPKGGGPMTSV
jgi:serine/threonine-protein kinase